MSAARGAGYTEVSVLLSGRPHPRGFFDSLLTEA